MAEVASLVYDVFFDNIRSKQNDQIRKIVEDKTLWAFTGILYVPNKGVYIQDNPEIRCRMPYMIESDLEGKIKAGDPSVRLVPYGYPTGEMTSRELRNNPFVTALVGGEGARKLAEVVDKSSNKSVLSVYRYVDKPTTRVSHISARAGDPFGLMVSCGAQGDGSGCYGFGVQKDTKEEK